MKQLIERVRFYNNTIGQRFPASKLKFEGNFISGVWMIGNCYRNKTRYYGAYPHSYLKRITQLFPDCEPALHLFSGSLSVDDVNYLDIRFDANKELNPDVVGDAEKLSTYFDKDFFDIVYADPPYSNEDALHYGKPMVNRNKVLKECLSVLRSNGFIVWLDQVYPMYRKIELKLVGTIGLIRSTNHRIRMVFIYQKLPMYNTLTKYSWKNDVE
jgi:hypothetical protein